MTTAVSVTLPSYESTCTTVTAADDLNRSSSNASITSHTGLLRGIIGTGLERTFSSGNKKRQEQRDARDRYVALNLNGIMQTQEVRVQVHDKDVDPRKLDIGYAV